MLWIEGSVKVYEVDRNLAILAAFAIAVLGTGGCDRFSGNETKDKSPVVLPSPTESTISLSFPNTTMKATKTTAPKIVVPTTRRTTVVVAGSQRYFVSVKPKSRSYGSCAEVRAAGAAPLHRADPGYSLQLDRDGDGIACE